jgi:hypothetical protein
VTGHGNDIFYFIIPYAFALSCFGGIKVMKSLLRIWYCACYKEKKKKNSTAYSDRIPARMVIE